MTRVHVRPEMLLWARERAGLTLQDLTPRIPQLAAWERAEKQPTLKQLEEFAEATHTPIGFLFLAKPPEERVPIPDFRTLANREIARPSPNLLDTIYLCQQRQDWYRDFARAAGEGRLDIVGSVRLTNDVVAVAASIRQTLGFDLEERRGMPTWTDALRRFIEQADTAGVLVMVSGVVGSNTHRKLEPSEFRGFALVDGVAPLIFINGADTKAAQMFTLAHELAHVWLGQSGLTDAEARTLPDDSSERWCSRVAAELLVPLTALRQEYDPGAELRNELDRLARRFKVSKLVILRRIFDANGLSRKDFWDAYDEELAHLSTLPAASGGNFYLTLGARASKRFTRALVASTLEGRSSFTEAFRLLGFKKMATFRELGNSLGLGF